MCATVVQQRQPPGEVTDSKKVCANAH